MYSSFRKQTRRGCAARFHTPKSADLSGSFRQLRFGRYRFREAGIIKGEGAFYFACRGVERSSL